MEMQLVPNQWRLCRIQLVNWGTFDGYTDLPIRPDDAAGNASVVCITGRSGTGKSTLFDAGTVLMMPYGRTLNAASNLARGGSPREVRTYLKGMIDTVADQRGRAKGKYLRDDTALIWSAIVHTWVDSTGTQFSAARFFQLKPGGGDGDLDQTFVTHPGPLDPRAMRPYAATRFRARDLRNVYEGCTVHDGSGKFFRAIYLMLGIGADGNGTNAMKLLYRIQSGIPMTNVDDLFKELVLEAPSTFALAEQAIASYDQNEDVWRKIDEAKRKRAMLEGIDDWHVSMLEAAERVRLIESLDHGSHVGPFQLWIERHRLELAKSERAGQTRALTRCADDLAKAMRRREDLKARLADIQQSIFEHGGGAVQHLRSELDRETLRRRDVARRRATLERVLDQAGKASPTDSASWSDLVAWADQTLETAPRRRDEIQARMDELGARLFEARANIGTWEEELEYYRSHRTRITTDMARARAMMAQAAGLDPSDIPFAAELMDLPREQEMWRTAVNISLAHIADRILVDKRLEAKFRRDIDTLASRLGRRYHFDFVDLNESYLAEPQPDHVSSKVVYRDDSPFASYVRNLVCNHSTDHRCVEGVHQLAGQGPRITPSGQERVGNRGAIGHSRNTLIIGYSNESVVQDCESQLANAREVERDILAQQQTVRRTRSQLDSQLMLAQTVSGLGWDEVDLAGVDEHIAQLQEDLERLEHDSELQALYDLLDRTQGQSDQTVAECNRLHEDQAELEHDIVRLDTLAEQGVHLLQAMEREGIAITQDQAQLCTDAVAQTEATIGERGRVIRSFDRVMAQARAHLDELIGAKRSECQRSMSQLETALRNYHATFMPEDGEHGTSVEEYPYYHAVLAELVRQRLDDPEQEWEAEMLRGVGQHLSRLQDAFVREERLLDERLRPVNEILGQLDFGEHKGHLSVVATRQTMSDVTHLRRELRRLTRLATTYDFKDDNQVKREHRALGRFVEVLRHDLATTGKSARRFLDTRHIVRITALETPPAGSGADTVVYDSINGKSGGQYQELVAFILGSALLYCLGYNSATLPSYAPIFLDEAFIKADSEHTRRALGALSGLGFQVIIAVPDGKVEAVAPLAAQIIGLSKDEQTNMTHARSLLRADNIAEGEPTWQG